MLPKTRQLGNNTVKVTVRACRAVAFVFLSFFCLLSFASYAHAQADQPASNEVGAQTADNFGITTVGQNINVPAPANADLRVLIVRILNLVLGFLGLIAFCIVLYAGYLWMTSRGNEEQVMAAKKMLINGVIGLVIIMAAFTITSFILRALRSAINGNQGENTTTPPVVQTYSFSGSLGSIIKDHYPKRDQHDVARNTSIVVTFGVPVRPESLIQNTNRSCWNSTFSGPTTTCQTSSGGAVTPTTDPGLIVNPYYGDCADLNRDQTISTASECDQLTTTAVVIAQKSQFSDSNTLLDGQTGVAASALATYDSDRNAFTFVFKPHEYLGSSAENITYRVDLTTALMRSDTGRSVFENQFTAGYIWDFTTGNLLDLDPPHVVDVFPTEGSIVPRNSIIQITFSESIDPTTVERVIESGTAGFITTLLNQTANGSTHNILGSWRLTNGYTTLEFTPSQECGVNSCGQKMFCLEVECDGGAACTNSYGGLLRTAEWTHNVDAPFEALPFSGIYDLAFNGLDNLSDNTVSTHLTKPDSSIELLIRNSEKAPDNYFWNFQVSNTIDRTAPYIEEVNPGVDAEDVSGDQDVHVQFSTRMWQRTLGDIALEEYPSNICADAALPQGGGNSCKKLDTLWYRLDSTTHNEKTKTNFEHREFGPNNLDLYYIPSIPSTVKSVTQNCVYPGIGPSLMVPSAPNTPSTCVTSVNSDGVVVPGEGCVPVTLDPTTDTGCAYTPESPNNTLGSINECITKLHSESPSSY